MITIATVTSLDFNISSHWDGAGIREAKAQIDELDAALRRISGDSARITIELETADAKAKIDEIKRDLDALSGKSARIKIDLDDSGAKEKIAGIKRDMDSLGNKGIRLTADDSDAVRKISEIKRDLDTISGKSVAIRADDSEAVRKIDEIKRDLESISNKSVRIEADNRTAVAKIDELKRDIDTLSNKSVRLEVDNRAAMVKIDELKLAIDRLNGKSIKVDADTSSATRHIDELKAREDSLRDKRITITADTDRARAGLQGVGSDAGNAGRAMGGLIGVAALVAPAIVPIGAAALGAGGAIVSSFSSATLAAAPFAASLFGTFKSATSVYQAIQPLNDQLQLQQQKLSTLTPGTKAYTSEQAKIATTQAQINQQMSNATPIQQKLVAQLGTLHDAWQSFQQQAEKTTGPILSSAFTAVTAAIPKMLPLVQAVGPIFQKLADQAAKFAESNGFKNFVDWVVKNGVPNLKNIMDTIGHLFVALGEIVKAFAPLGLSFTGWLSKITLELDKWGQNGGFQRFAASVKGEMPQVVAFFKALGEAAVHVIEAMNNLGPVSLILATDMLKLVAAMPPQVVDAFFLAFAAWKIFGAITVAVQALGTAMEFLRGVMIAARIAAIAFDVSMGVMVGTVGLVVLAVAAVGVGIFELVTHWTTVWNAIKSVTDTVITFLRSKLGLLVLALGPIGAIAWIAANWKEVWGAVKTTAETVWNALKIGYKAFIDFFKTATQSSTLRAAWDTLWGGMKTAAQAVWTAMQTAWRAVVQGFQQIWQTTSAALSSSWNTVWNGLKTAAQATWSAMQTAWRTVVQGFQQIWQTTSAALTASWNTVWNGMKTAAQAIWTAMQTAWRTVVQGFQQIWQTTSAALTSSWNSIWNGMKTAADTIWNAMKTAWQAALNAMKSTLDTVGNAMKSAWQAVWNAMKAASDAVWNAMKTAWTAAMNAMKSTLDTVTNAMKSAWQTVWNAMKAASDAVWNAMKTAWTAAMNAMKSTLDSVMNAMKSAWQAAWNAMKSAADAVWNAMKAAWQAAMNAMKSTLDSVSNAMKSVWQGFWNTMKSVATTVWNAISSGFKSFASGVESTLSGLVSRAQSIWNGIVNIFKTPVNAVINIWDHVAGAVGLPQISKLASGGHVQGAGTATSDSIPAMLSHGEFVMNAAAVDHYGLDTMGAMNSRRLASGGPVHLATGGSPNPKPNPGLFGSGIGPNFGPSIPGAHAVGTGLKAIGSVVATAVYDVSKPLLDAALKLVPHPIPGVARPAGDVPYDGAKKIVDAILSKLKSAQDSAKAAAASGGGKGTIPSAQHKALIDQALKAAGIPQSEWGKWEAGLNTLIGRESSWNSSSINLTDSNAKAGHPSQGLMQLIPSNFAQFHVAGTSNQIMDPLANIAAGIKYILSRYGDITRVQQANASAPPKGYMHGTGYAMGGLAMVGEAGPEMVNFRGGEGVAPFQRLLAAARGDSKGHGEVNMPINITATGGNSQEVVAQIEAELIPKLRMLMQQHVGWRNR